jgi:hypothetical protein
MLNARAGLVVAGFVLLYLMSRIPSQPRRFGVTRTGDRGRPAGAETPLRASLVAFDLAAKRPVAPYGGLAVPAMHRTEKMQAFFCAIPQSRSPAERTGTPLCHGSPADASYSS